MNTNHSQQLTPRVLILEETVRSIKQAINEQTQMHAQYAENFSIIKQSLREHSGRINVIEDSLERGFERMDQGFAELKVLIRRMMGE